MAHTHVTSYPDDNCAAVYDTGTAVDPNSVIWEYTSHQQVVNVLSYYEYSSAYAVTQNIPYIMFETNTASCTSRLLLFRAYPLMHWYRFRISRR